MKPIAVKLILIILAGWLFINPQITRSSAPVLYQNQVAVITYHHIDPSVQGDVTITPELFRSQLKDLLERNYHFITLEQLLAYYEGKEVPPNAVLVTFDDGYESFYNYAYPVLKELSVPAVNFVITQYLDDPKASKIASLSREQIQEMAQQSQLIDFQCHSDSLHTRQQDDVPLLVGKLPKETEDQYKQRITKDTTACTEKLAKLIKKPVNSYAYPFGAADPESVSLLESAGISYGFTTVNNMATRDYDKLHIPRINAGSPFIKFNSLNNTILKKIIAELDPSAPVPVAKVLQSLDARRTSKGNQELEFSIKDRSWKISLDSSTVQTPNGPIVLRQKPILKKRNVQLRWDDVQTMLGAQLRYHPYTDSYSLKPGL